MSGKPRNVGNCSDCAKMLLSRIVEDTATGCWEWQGANSSGYGAVWWNLKLHRTHRLSYETFVSEIPTGGVICHKCDNPSCINPSHLFCGTHADNVRDKISKGRGRAPAVRRGMAHSMSVLNDQQIIEIRSRFDAGESSTSIAKDFDVTPAHICSICRGTTWKHLPRCHRKGRAKQKTLTTI